MGILEKLNSLTMHLYFLVYIILLLWHTCAKLIEIKLLYLQKRHGLHESVGKMESNDTPHGSQFGSLLL